MSPSFGYGRGRKIYRYYVSASVLPGRNQTLTRSDIIRRVPAAPIEALVIERLGKLLAREQPLSWDSATDFLRRVEIHEQSIHLLIEGGALIEPHEAAHAIIARLQNRLPIGDGVAIDHDGSVRFICYRRAVFQGGRSWRREVNAAEASRPTIDPALTALLKASHKLLAAHDASPLDTDRHPHARPAAYQRERRMMAIGLLAPDIQRAILEGRAPAALTVERLLAQDLPIGWTEQRKAFGLAG